MSETLLFLIPLLPLCCAVINMLFGMRLPRLFAEIMAVTGVAGAFLLTLLFWGYAEGEGTRVILFTWLNSGDGRRLLCPEFRPPGGADDPDGDRGGQPDPSLCRRLHA